MYAVTLPLSGPLALPAAEGGESGDFWSSAYPILPHPVELIFGLVTFGILYWIVRTRVVPRLEEIYAERTAAIEGGISKAEEAQAAAQAALDQYNLQLQEGREEATRIREDAKAQGAQIIAELREKANQEAGGSPRARTSRSRPSASRRSSSCAARSAACRPTWPAGSSASRWRTRRVSAASSSGSSPSSRPATSHPRR